jgi:hypothetical protein
MGALDSAYPLDYFIVPSNERINVQTFLPYRHFRMCAEVLDYRRLGKQRVEAKQILMALRGESKGWIHHPATKMWRGCEYDLSRYGWTMCEEWKRRGYKDTIQSYFGDWSRADDREHASYPSWIDVNLTLSHQSNLVRKMPEYYGKIWPHVPDNLPYLWPV